MAATTNVIEITSHPAYVQYPVKPSYNTSAPNYILNGDLWNPRNGRTPSANAVLVYLWMIDKTTEAEELEDGGREGLVIHGRPISFMDIADSLGISWSSVQRAVKYLTSDGVKLIKVNRNRKTSEYTFRVLKCRKEFKESKTDGVTRRPQEEIDARKAARQAAGATQTTSASMSKTKATTNNATPTRLKEPPAIA